MASLAPSSVPPAAAPPQRPQLLRQLPSPLGGLATSSPTRRLEMNVGGKDADGENCTSASHGNDRECGRERAGGRCNGDEDVRIRRRSSVGAAGFSTTDGNAIAGLSRQEHGTAAAAALHMPVSSFSPVEPCSWGEAAVGVEARGTGHSPADIDIDIDSETEHGRKGEAGAKQLRRVRPSKSQRVIHGDWRVGKSGGDGHTVGKGAKAAGSRQGSTAAESIVWMRMPLPSRFSHRAAAPRMPASLPLPAYYDQQGLGKQYSQPTAEDVAALLRPEVQTTTGTPSGAADVARASIPSSARLDYASALTRLAAALHSRDTTLMRGVLPPVDELLARLVPALLCGEEGMLAINCTASRDPDVEVDGYCANLRRLIGRLGRELKGEAEGSSVKAGVALALQTRSLPERAVRQAVAHSEAFHDDDPLHLAEREGKHGEQSADDEDFMSIRDFILASHAYASFQARLMAFAHEPYWRRVDKAVGDRAIGDSGKMLHPEDLGLIVEELSWVPVYMFTFTECHSFRLSLVDRVKAFVEGHMDGEGDWSPMSPRVHMLEEGFCRLRWRSPCGASRHLDVPQGARERLQAAFDSSPAFLQSSPVPSAAVVEQLNERSEASKTQHVDHGCLSLRRLSRNWRSPQIVYSSVALNISLKQALTGPASAIAVNADHDRAWSASPADAGSSQQLIRQSTKPVFNQHDETTADPPSTTAKTELHSNKHHHLYLCIQRNPLRFEPIDCHNLTNDDELFTELKHVYDQTRGLKRRWLSVWRFDRCEFYEFQKYAADRASLVGPRFPKAKDHSYAFEPRPPRPLPPHGPVSAGEFRDRYYAASRHPFWASWKAPQGSTGDGSTSTDPEKASSAALKAMPKRKGQLAMGGDGREGFFGLLAVEVVSFAGVAAYVLLANTPWMVFMPLWMVVLGHPADLQNAAVPAGVSLALTGIVVACLVK